MKIKFKFKKYWNWLQVKFNKGWKWDNAIASENIELNGISWNRLFIELGQVQAIEVHSIKKEW
jgi:hypothetical protein